MKCLEMCNKRLVLQGTELLLQISKYCPSLFDISHNLFFYVHYYFASDLIHAYTCKNSTYIYDSIFE